MGDGVERMSLRIAFIGYDENQTCTYFRELAELNSERIGICDLSQGRIVLRDGTEILRISPNVRFVSLNFDQIIISDDSRNSAAVKNHSLLCILAQRLLRSSVPPEFRWQYYNLDAEVE